MAEVILTDEQFKRLGNFDVLSADYYVLALGIALQYEYSPPGIKYSTNYKLLGGRLWNSFRSELYDVICNRNESEPREWINDLITGDIRNLLTGIVTAITARYDVTIAIALPVAALVLKTGVLNYCSEPPQKLPSLSVEKILENKKKQFTPNQKSKKVSQTKKRKNK